MPDELITSTHNPKVKQLLALQQKSSLRRETGLFVVEGARELEHCLEGGFELDTVFFCPELADEPILKLIKAGASGHKAPGMFALSREVYEKVAYRESTEGIIAEVRCKERRLSDLKLGDNPLVMVLESVEKPGNLGAILRSADAAGADALIVCDPLTDIYNPNIIRSSIGAFFTVPVAVCSSEEAIKFLKDKNIQILTAQLQDSSYYYDTDMRRGTALVMGTEATGLTEIWRQAADAHILIPMLGKLDSLNVSVSAAVLLYEAVRQRKQK